MNVEAAYHMNLIYFQEPLRLGDTRVYQIGRMFCLPTTVVDTHCHTNLFELTVATSGCGTVTTNSVPCEIKQGDIYISFPGDFHKIESDSENPLRFDFFAFDSTSEEIRAGLEHLMETHYSARKRIIHDERISFLVRNAIAEINSDDYGQDKILTHIIEQIPIYLLRDRRAKPTPDYVTPKDTDAFCYRVMNFIDSHIYTIKGLCDISEAIGYSVGYLSALFRKSTSHSLYKYLDDRRKEAARLLVLEGILSISEISEKLNYSSVYAFSKAFRNWFGISPRRYAEEYSGGKNPSAETNA